MLLLLCANLFKQRTTSGEEKLMRKCACSFLSRITNKREKKRKLWNNVQHTHTQTEMKAKLIHQMEANVVNVMWVQKIKNRAMMLWMQ